MHTIIVVLEFPPLNYKISILRHSFNNLVSLESLYGTKDDFLDLSERIFIQLPNANRDLLILAPSCKPLPKSNYRKSTIIFVMPYFF
jgi:hypothetical protein